MSPLLLLPLLSLAAPARAADLVLAFDGSRSTAGRATLTGVGADPRLATVQDTQGDAWVISVSVTREASGQAHVSGTARLVDVPDPKQLRRFEVDLPWGQTVPVRVADPAGKVHALTVVATSVAPQASVGCELLVAPTVDEMAEAMQRFVDDGLTPHTGVGSFTLGDQVTEATWICGW